MIWKQFVGHLSALMQALERSDEAADETLARYLREHSQLGVRDRARLADALFATLRQRRWWQTLLDAQGETAVSPQAWALLAAREIGWAPPEWTAAEHAWLAAVAATESTLEAAPAQRASMPDWLWQALLEQGAPDLPALAAAFNQAAPVDLRVNVHQAKRDMILRQMHQQGWAVEATPHSPWGLRLAKRRGLRDTDWWRKGLIEVQDEGSQLLAALLGVKRGELVVDFCAGGGGKTLALGALMRDQGRILALDTSAARLAALAPRLQRAGLHSVYPMVISDENDVRLRVWNDKVARVLVDAPCSGLGTLRRSPQLKWRLQAADIAAFARRQEAILEAAARLVQPGGRLVYATCSILMQENEAVAQAFERDHPGFVRLSAAQALQPWVKDARARAALCSGDDLRLWPHLHGSDGFYAALWQRCA